MMKKNLKKLSALLAAALLTAGSVFPAYAETKTTTITVTGKGAGFSAYRILDADSQLKENDKGDTCVEHTDGIHTATCYTYHYAINADYQEAINQLFDGDTSIDRDASGNVTSEAFIKYIEAMTDSDGNTDTEKVDAFASSLYAQITVLGENASATLANEGNSETHLFEDVPQGYYLIVEDTAAEGDSISKIMLDTAGQTKANIATKDAVPALNKTIIDGANEKNDSVGVKDTVYYKLRATVPSDIERYSTYKMVFTDTLPNGLDFSELDTSKFTVKVYLAGDAAGKEDMVTLDAADYAVNYGASSNKTATITIENLLSLSSLSDSEGKTRVNANTVVTVEYETVVNEYVVVGSAGNPNTAYLEFSNNPSDTSAMGKTPESSANVFTFQLNVNKEDATGNALKGASFSLWKYNEAKVDEYGQVKNEDESDWSLVGKAVYVGDETSGSYQFNITSANDTTRVDSILTPSVSTEGTVFTFKGISEGTYKLVEDEPPTGYNQAEDIKFRIQVTGANTDGTITSIDVRDISDANTKVSTVSISELDSGIFETTVVNSVGVILPSTGGAGAGIIFALGTAAVVLYIFTGKKKDKKQ